MLFPHLVRRSTHFNPLPPHGGRPSVTHSDGHISVFQSTPSAWRETLTFDYCRVSINHFNPLPPHGGRHWSGSVCRSRRRYFNPLPPHGGRHRLDAVAHCAVISIHSLRMEGDPFYGFIFPPGHISIHSLRMEGDLQYDFPALCINCISIHSLRMEGDVLRALFQRPPDNFNPLPPHGGRRLLRQLGR